MDGDPENDIFTISPHQLDVVGGEADHSIVFLGQLSWKLVCPLREERRGISLPIALSEHTRKVKKRGGKQVWCQSRYMAP